MFRVGLYTIAAWGVPVAFVFFLLSGHQFFHIDPPNHGNGNCTRVTGAVGIEDVQLHNDMLYASGDDRLWFVHPGFVSQGKSIARAKTQGALHQVDLREATLSLEKLELLDYPYQDFHPHGISVLYSKKNDKLYLIVVNHRRDADAVDVFEKTGPSQLHFLYTTTHVLFRNLNDVIGHFEDEEETKVAFYTTNWAYYPFNSLMSLFELVSARAWTSVVHCSGFPITPFCKEVVPPSLKMANGVSLSHDTRTLYVVALNSKSVYIYDRDELSNDVELNTIVPVDSGCDNVDISADGTLVMGCHASTYKLVKHQFLNHTAPSQVIEVTPLPDGTFSVEELFYSSGQDFPGSTVGVLRGTKADPNRQLVIGGVKADGLLVCNLPQA